MQIEMMQSLALSVASARSPDTCCARWSRRGGAAVRADPDPQRWLEAFPSFGYLLVVEPAHAGEVIARFESVAITASVIAELIDTPVLDVHYEDRRARYRDLARETRMGFGRQEV